MEWYSYVVTVILLISSVVSPFLYFSNIDLNIFMPFEKACKEENLPIAAVELSKISQALSKQISKE